MPFLTVDDARLFYHIEGNDDRPVLVFSNSLGTDHSSWNLQVADLLPCFRILRYDTRGHGASDASPGDYAMERLARDVLALTDALAIDRFAFCGLSLGGMTGQWLAARVPERVSHLVLANTSARIGPELMETRRRTVLAGGMAAIAGTAMERFFSPETLAGNDPQIASARPVLLGTDPVGYAGCCAAIRDMDQTGLLASIRVPTLLIVGERDVPTPWEGHGEVIAREIPNVRVVRLAAAHLSNIEDPPAFTAALREFLLSGGVAKQ